ncbi:diguanylate cyclase [Ideonella sp. YS5]
MCPSAPDAPPSADPALPARSSLAEAEAAHERGDLPECERSARRAWLDAGVTGQSRSRAGFLLACSLYRMGRFDTLDTVHRAVVQALTDARSTEQACQVLRWVALGVPEIGRFNTGLEAARAGLRLAEEAGLAASRVKLINALAACFERIGDPWQAERLLGDALALAQARGGDEEHFVCLNNLSAVALTRHELLRDGGDADGAQLALEQARERAHQGLVLAGRLGDPFYSVYVESNLGDALNHLGRHEEAARLLDTALQRAQQHRFDSLCWRVQCSLGELAVNRGQLTRAADELSHVIVAMGESPPQVTLMRALRALSRARRGLGDAAGALEAFERFHGLQRRRSVAQLTAQAEHLVTRLEIEQTRLEARAQRERANALEEAALRDPLTGLLNRRGCERALHALLADRRGAPLSVAMVDVDHFKSINDAHGHAAGDHVLAALGRLLREHGRPHDVVARLGGEEFLLAWPGSSPAQAAEIAERLRQEVAGRDWRIAAAGLRVSISIGVAALLPAAAGGSTLGELLADADAALYRAKRAGRDCVELAADDTSR